MFLAWQPSCKALGFRCLDVPIGAYAPRCRVVEGGAEGVSVRLFSLSGAALQAFFGACSCFVKSLGGVHGAATTA